MGTQQEREEARRVRRRAGKWLALAVVSVVALCVLACAVLVYTGDRAVRAELEAARAAGEPVDPSDLDDLHPRPDPDEGPHAADVYGQAFQAHRALSPSTPPELPIVGRQRDGPRGTPWPPEWLDEAELYLTEREEVYELLSTASGMGPARFDVDYGSYLLGTPHLSEIRNASNLLSLRAEWGMRADRLDDAVSTLVVLWGLTDALAEEPLLISQFARMSSIATAIDVTESLLFSVEDLNPAQVRRLRDAADGVEVIPSLKLGLMGDRVTMEEVFRQVREGTYGAQRLEERLAERVRRATGMFQRDRATMLRAIREQLERLRAAQRGERDESVEVAPLPVYAWTSHMGKQSWESALRGEQLLTTRLALVRTGLAVAQHVAEHGEYPETLEALVPEYLDAVPEDLFSEGDPILYRVTETGAIVYSVGQDGLDEGGRELTARGDRGRGRAATDLTFTLGNAQAELWPEQWTEPDGAR